MTAIGETDISREKLHISDDGPTEERTVKKIVEGKVIRKKASPVKGVASKFFGGDPLDVLKYMFNSVVVPMAQDMFVSMMNSGTERLVYGDTIEDRKGRRNGIRFGGNPSYRNYGAYSTRPNRQEVAGNQRELSARARREHDFDEIILESKGEAEEVLANMTADVERYGSISVAALYEMVGITPTYVDRSWGWKDMRGSSISVVRSGFLLNLPDIEVLR
jgi:hypothetical protein